MAKGTMIMEVRAEGSVQTAYLQLSPDIDQKIRMASIDRALVSMHPSLEDEFNIFLSKIVSTIVESIGDRVDSMIKVPASEIDSGAKGH